LEQFRNTKSQAGINNETNDEQLEKSDDEFLDEDRYSAFKFKKFESFRRNGRMMAGVYICYKNDAMFFPLAGCQKNEKHFEQNRLHKL